MIPQDAPPAPEATTRRRSPPMPRRPRALKPAIIAAISTVFDPEIPVNIWELGLIYDVAVTAEASRAITHDADGARLSGGAVAAGRGRVEGEGCAGISDAKVDVVWEPGWTKDRMSDAAKLQLGLW